MDRRRTCPECGDERTFDCVASTEMHLGEKTKWRCPGCSYTFVRIDDEVDTAEI